VEDTNIEILEQKNIVRKDTIVALPMNFVPIGTVEHDSVQIYIKQDVYKQIEKFAREDTSKEVGSILIGEYVEEKDRKTVIISNYIEAKYTSASAATLTFTHETWEDVYREKDRKYQDKTIVGWQHTHPGYGIFLSNYDIFIQENFFNLPWQVAYVVDPIADTRGFFEWKNGKVCKMSGFYVYDEIGTEIKISQKKQTVQRHISIGTITLSFLLLLSIMISISVGIEKNIAIQKLNEALSKKDQENIFQVPDATTVTKVEHLEDIESFKVYTVQKNDYLERICEKHGLDYMENIQKIMKINGITDVNRIYIGQQLYLPLKK